MSLRALIFDFDGLILATEEPIYQAWCEVYAEQGLELSLADWLTTIGTWGAEFDPRRDLQTKLGPGFDVQAADHWAHQRAMSLINAASALPGVADLLAAARRAGLKLAIASSSERAWVLGHLGRLGLADCFDCVRVREDVRRTKPDPELYLAAAACLGVQPHEALALEDSAHGVTAAKAAGLYCAAVPTPLTSRLDFSQADLRLASLAQLSLAELMQAVENANRQKTN